MKNWILTLLSNRERKIKKTTARIVLVTLTVNILSPILTYAALPSFGNSLIQDNVPAVAQINTVVLPRDLVLNDNLQISLSGSISGSMILTQDYSGSHLETAEALNSQIDALPDYISIYDDSIRTFTITSENPGIPFDVGNLRLDRGLINSTTPVNNVVAIAQESELLIPQQLFVGDVIDFSIDGISVSQAFTGSRDSTLQAFADQITSLTNASGSYDNISSKVQMIAKNAGTSFSMSNLVITSFGINPINIQPNIVPVAQIDTPNFTRPIYNDEIITFTLSGNIISQAFDTDYSTTLTSLSSQISTISNIDSTYTGGVLSINSLVPGLSFPSASVTISGATMNGVL
ncbi:MAG: hypothetical protein PHZ26_01225 [Candidatus Gracilibacteria bacterium]|nr:hypothetical protein [Candidatus Gracilibacteria bacterium]MDD2908356.1 hypothetical protein [Candidatus Gracilibacteria bacterium]